MKSFLAVYRSKIKGVLSGWDRLRMRGTLRLIANRNGMEAYLTMQGILLKHFKAWAMSLTEQVRRSTERIAEAAGRPIEHLRSSQIRKEDRAKEIAEGDRVTEGLVCVRARLRQPSFRFRSLPAAGVPSIAASCSASAPPNSHGGSCGFCISGAPTCSRAIACSSPPVGAPVSGSVRSSNSSVAGS